MNKEKLITEKVTGGKMYGILYLSGSSTIFFFGFMLSIGYKHERFSIQNKKETFSV